MATARTVLVSVDLFAVLSLVSLLALSGNFDFFSLQWDVLLIIVKTEELV